MTDTDKVTLTIGQIKQLIKEAQSPNTKAFYAFGKKFEKFEDWLGDVMLASPNKEKIENMDTAEFKALVDEADKTMKAFKDALSKFIKTISE